MHEDNTFFEMFKKDMGDELNKSIFSDYPSCEVLSSFGEVCFALYVACFACFFGKVMYEAIGDYYDGQKNNA